MRRESPTRPLPLAVLLALAVGCADSAPIDVNGRGGASGTDLQAKLAAWIDAGALND